jgi:hypothetical protein
MVQRSSQRTNRNRSRRSNRSHRKQVWLRNHKLVLERERSS